MLFFFYSCAPFFLFFVFFKGAYGLVCVVTGIVWEINTEVLKVNKSEKEALAIFVKENKKLSLQGFAKAQTQSKSKTLSIH